MPELAGDLVLASHADGRTVIEFSKTPLPMVTAQVSPGRWRIQFPARRLAFGGGGQPSKRFAWLYLSAALKDQPVPAAFQFERIADGSWRLENRRTGEMVEGFLSP